MLSNIIDAINLSDENTIVAKIKYIAHFQSFKDDLSKKEDSKGKSNPALWIGIIALLSPVFSQVISEFGKYLIEIFKNTPQP